MKENQKWNIIHHYNANVNAVRHKSLNGHLMAS